MLKPILALVALALTTLSLAVLAPGCGGSAPDCPSGCEAHYYIPPTGGAGHWECDPVAPGAACPEPGGDEQP
jgi:hypothetical protein